MGSSSRETVPPTHSHVNACIWALLHHVGDTRPPGENYLRKFIKRHSEMKSKVDRRQGSVRSESFAAKAVNWYFDIQENEYEWIKAENIVNVDEGGIMAGFYEYKVLFKILNHVYSSPPGSNGLIVGSSQLKKRPSSELPKPNMDLVYQSGDSHWQGSSTCDHFQRQGISNSVV